MSQEACMAAGCKLWKRQTIQLFTYLALNKGKNNLFYNMSCLIDVSVDAEMCIYLYNKANSLKH